ncbi:Protein bric-a-brac 1 [Camponotus floridanus]|uniref:Protein bric-a-brac 1 n=1 Tax=Camponotus floridanus TaxID=104421 RepID=E2AEB4_CAMFO|nr:Protein bric-a-brac 1 [Camponotus floridanus]
MTSAQKYCLRWNNHRSNLLSVFEDLLQTEAFTDVSLVADNGQIVKCHKIVLAACSSYFQSLFIALPCLHPTIILKDVKYSELRAILEYIYRGEVNVQHDQLKNLLKIAQMLQIKGLVEYDDNVGGRFSQNDFHRHEDMMETSLSPPPAISTSTNATNMAVHSSGHMSPPHSTDGIYGGLYNKGRTSGTTSGTTSDFNQMQNQFPYWSLPSLLHHQLSPRSSSILPSALSGNGGSSSYDGFTESLKRKKTSLLNPPNHDTPILRTVLGQSHADSSLGTSMLQSDNHEPMHLRSSSNGSANDDNHRGNIDSAHNETAHSSHTEPSVDEDEKRPSSQSHTTNIKSGNGTHAQSKPEWKRYKQYTRDDIQGAIEAVKRGMSAVQAARMYNVPSRTLYDKVKKLGIPTSRPLKRSTSNGDSAASFPFDVGANVNGRIYSGSMLSKNENENSGNLNNFEHLSISPSSANTYDVAYKTSKDTSQDHDSMSDSARYSTSPVIRCPKQKQQQNVEDEVEDLSVNRKSDVPVIRLTSDTVKDEPQETGPNSDCGDYS